MRKHLQKLLHAVEQNRNSVLLVSLLALLQITFGAMVAFAFIERQNWLPQASLPEQMLFYAIALLCMSLSLVSATLIALLSGFVLGWQAIPFVVVSYMVACVPSYWLGYFADSGRFLGSISRWPRFQALLRHLGDRPLLFVSVIRVLPVGPPFAITNVILSLLQIRFAVFMAGSLLGMLPRSILAVALGRQARLLADRPEQALWHPLTWIMLVLSLAALVWVVLKAWRKSQQTAV
jgi:uncharacterized membrane protein YdjX (TVP38/TMEM64 family)